MELLFLDRPGRLMDATRGYKIEKKEKKMRNTGTRIHTHDIHTPAARLMEKKNTTKVEHFYIHDACASA